MSLQTWVANTILERDGFAPPKSAVIVGPHGIHITRARQPDAYAYCPDASDSEPFMPADLGYAVDEMPELEFIVVVRRVVGNDTYDLADHMGIPIGGVGDLK